jgi:TctA family transporter
MTSLPAPTSSSTAVPGLSSAQAHFLSSKLKGSHNGKKIAAIVGGTLCGIALVAAFVALYVWRARVKRRKTTRAAAAVIFGTHAMPMQEKVSRPREEPVDAVSEAI